MLSLHPLCPAKLKPPGEQTHSITLPLNWGSAALLRQHHHLVHALCIGFPGKLRSSVCDGWKQNPNPRPTHPTAEYRVLCPAHRWPHPGQGHSHLRHLLPALWGCGCPDIHPAVGPADPACAQCCAGHSREGRGTGCAGKAQGGWFRDSFTFASLSTVIPVG